MNYKITVKNDEIYFKYMIKRNNKKNFSKKVKKENPFGILKSLNLN